MNTSIKTREFDAAEYLGSEESIAAFVGDAIESGDAVVIQNALGTAARARGMAQIADATGLGRESLYKALRPEAKPRFDTVLKVMSALGIKISVEATGQAAPAASHAMRAHTTGRHTTTGSSPAEAPTASKPAKLAAKKAPAGKRPARHA